MVDAAEARVVVELTYHEARALRSSAMSKAKKRRNAAAKSDFQPGPGKLDLNLAEAEVLETAAGKIDQALTKAITELKTWK